MGLLENPEKLVYMANKARGMAVLDAESRIVDLMERAVNGRKKQKKRKTSSTDI